jgi:dihydroorotate dehydrogenase electron transfer subunit
MSGIMSRMKKVTARITANEEIRRGFFRMRAASAYLAKASKPGQFVEIRCPGGADTLLRRPLGVHKITASGIEMLYEVVGKGTGILSRMAPGRDADIIGPLGNGFGIRPSRPAVLVAGGIGVAPLVALAARLKGASVIIGAKKASHVLCEREFRSLGCRVSVSTEDGSKGRRGLATELLGPLLDSLGGAGRPCVYACGPAAMLKAVASIALARGAECQVSLEERMACGTGVCLGCPVGVRKGGYKMVCKDGPVFDAKEIAW